MNKDYEKEILKWKMKIKKTIIKFLENLKHLINTKTPPNTKSYHQININIIIYQNKSIYKRLKSLKSRQKNNLYIKYKK